VIIQPALSMPGFKMQNSNILHANVNSACVLECMSREGNNKFILLPN